MKNLVILGGGFAGLWAAMAAAGERANAEATHEIRITLISRDAHLVIRPRLYEGAGEDKRVLLKPLLDKIGVTFLQASVEAIDPVAKVVELAGGSQDRITYDRMTYDSVILATGSKLKELPVPGAKTYSFSADTYEDAQALDRQLQAIVCRKETAAKTIVVVGAGFTGLELATELRARLKKMSKEAYRLVLVDRYDVAGQELGINPKPYIDEALRLHDIDLRMQCSLQEIGQDSVTLSTGEVIASQTVVMATGMVASPLGRAFSENSGEELDRHGRLQVTPELAVAGHKGAFAAGDVAAALTDGVHRSLLSCQHAIQLGRFAGYNAVRHLCDKPLKAYEQGFYATCLDLGDWGALFTTGWDRVAEKTGAEGKAMKQMINTQWIYPPAASATPEEIYAFVAFEQEEKAA